MHGLGELARVNEQLDVIRLLDWIAARRTRAGGDNQASHKPFGTYVNYFRTRPLRAEPELHGYLKTELHVRRLPRKVIQPMAKLDLVERERESSLQVTKTTYSGLQEHRIIY
jgi:hypothetical protein